MDGRIVASTSAKAAGTNEPSPPPLYLVPFVFWMNKPAAVLQGREERARGPEHSDCRVTVAANNVGQAYSLDEFMECFGKPVGLQEWQKAVPAPARPCHQMELRSPPLRDLKTLEEVDQSETFMDIKNALIRLIDEEETVSTPFKLKVRNEKLTCAALRWSRCTSKMILFLRNDTAGRFRPGRVAAISEWPGQL